MKLSYLDPCIKIATFGLLVALMMPSVMFAQKNQYRGKPKKVKIVKPKYNKRATSLRINRLSVIPSNSRIISYRNENYYYSDGAYYLSRDGGYIVTRPPLGIRVNVLPRNHYEFKNLGHNYYYYNGVYYAPMSNSSYEVVSAPIGSLIEVLPDGYDIVELEGNVYYRSSDTYYKAIQEPNGYIVYEVVAI